MIETRRLRQLTLSGNITSFRGFSFFHSRQESVAFATRLLSARREGLRRATHARQLTKLDCPDCRHSVSVTVIGFNFTVYFPNSSGNFRSNWIVYLPGRLMS